MSEIRMPRAGCDNEIIVIEFAIDRFHFLRIDVDRLNFGQDHLDVLACAQNRAYWRRNVGRRKRSGCDLIEQRLKQMVVRPVDYGDADRFTRKLLGGLESAKAGTDNYDVRLLLLRGLHMPQCSSKRRTLNAQHPTPNSKEVVKVTTASIFRASCQSQFPAAKLAKQSRSGSRSPLAAKFCAPNRLGVICFPPRTRNANGTSAKWRGWTKRTRRE